MVELAVKRKWWKGKKPLKKYDREKIIKNVRKNLEQAKVDALQQERARLDQERADLNLERKMVKVQAAEAKLKAAKKTG